MKFALRSASLFLYLVLLYFYFPQFHFIALTPFKVNLTQENSDTRLSFEVYECTDFLKVKCGF